MLLEVCSGKERKFRIKNKPCIAHPLRRVRSVSESNFITYAAACNVLFFRAKLQDAWADDRNIGAWFAGVFFSLGNRRAKKRYRDFAVVISQELSTLNALEQDKCDSVDAIAEPFARLLSILFTVDGLLPGNISKDLASMGYHLGKWIYLVDAATDRADDRKKGSYNVYNIRYQTDPLPEHERLTRELCLAAIAESWENLKKNIPQCYTCEVGYLDNLFYLGLRAKEDSLSCTEEEELH